MTTARVKIKNRFTGDVIFTAEVDASMSVNLRLGAAVKLAIKARANLADANLTRAYLADANLADAYLAGANLAGANLAGAYLADANLADANLADAYLAGANLAGANLAGAYLAGANGLLDCGTPHGWRVVVNVFNGSLRIWAGCRSFTFKEAEAHWKKRADRKLMPPLLAYIKAAAKINKWPLTAPKKPSK
jgi:hypothetical protein